MPTMTPAPAPSLAARSRWFATETDPTMRELLARHFDTARPACDCDEDAPCPHGNTTEADDEEARRVAAAEAEAADHLVDYR